MKTIDVEEVKTFLETCGPNTKVYLGADSERFKKAGKWYADYTLAVVVHIDGNSGCRIFGEVQRELDYDVQKNKPRMRLMNEAYKISELYLKLADILEDFDVQVHLDINPNLDYGSSCVINEAIGYVKAMCNVIPMVKPNAPAASYCADRLKEVLGKRLA